jgi:hypothetical protein
MFGNPQWFRPKTVAFGVTTIKWQGWLYSLGWLGTIGLPFLLLVGRHQPLEAITWMGLSLAALTYDVRQILRSLRDPISPLASAASAGKADDILYILDNPPGQPLATRNYKLQVRG